MTQEEQKATEHGALLELILSLRPQFDFEYLREAAGTLRTRAARHDSVGPILAAGGYDPDNSLIMDLQAEALEHLVALFKCNERIAELKSGVANRASKRVDVMRQLFNL